MLGMVSINVFCCLAVSGVGDGLNQCVLLFGGVWCWGWSQSICFVVWRSLVLGMVSFNVSCCLAVSGVGMVSIYVICCLAVSGVGDGLKQCVLLFGSVWCWGWSQSICFVVWRCLVLGMVSINAYNIVINIIISNIYT